MANIAVAKQMTLHYLEEGIPVFWWGPPGGGKSQGVHQLANDNFGNMIDFRAILRDPTDLRGMPAADLKRKRAIWLVPDDLPHEDRDGPKGILFMDELNTANAQVQAACYGLVLDRKLGSYVLPKGWFIVAAGNRQSDRSAAQRMQRALASRFAHIDIDVDHKQWIDDFALENCHEFVVGFIHWRPALLHEVTMVTDQDKKLLLDERRFPTQRTWERVSRMCNKPANLRQALVTGLVGEVIAAEFEGFIRMYGSLPDINVIIKNPTSVDVPDEPSQLYAIAGALARKATRDNFANVLTFAGRMGREYEIVVGLDATKLDPMLTKTRAYIDFTQRNKDIQIGKFRTAA